MSLLPEDVRRQLPRLYTTEHLDLAEKQVVTRLFDPCSGWEWLLVEGQEDEETGEYLLWGLTLGFEQEWGYISLSELEGVRNRLGLKIERDLYFKPARLAEVLARD